MELKTVQQKLKELEQKYNITILYSCESGSRAWGFASPDSDWDVRFIYSYPKDYYLSIDSHEETLNFEIDENDLDLAGWEIRKVLRLFRSSNATPYEWLQSPIHYMERFDFVNRLWQLRTEYFRPRATAHHYLGLTKKSHKTGLQGEKFNIKKYFYVLRPLLAAWWIIEHKEAPPMEFVPLLALIKDQPDVYKAILELTERKKQANESDYIAPVPIIEQFITTTMEYCATHVGALPLDITPSDNLNALFRNLLLDVETL
ncbi:MAG: nucleotidyltransferase domain-containing protein [Aureispira sp.]|nr:nucleotidyltransferase domain-containing protein [Aureispira sp.]